MTGLDEFKTFKVTIPDSRRYWEDDETGVSIKKGQIVEIGPRQFRSAELKFALIRSQVLMVSGKAVFAFRENMVTVIPGLNGKNIIESVNITEPAKISIKPEVKHELKKDFSKDNSKNTNKKEEIKKINKIPDPDDIPDMDFEN